MESNSNMRHDVYFDTPEDEQLRQFFHTNRPSTTDDTTFLVGLSARMDTLAEIKECHDREIRRCHRIGIAALVTGILIGITAAILLITGIRLDSPFFTFPTALLHIADLDTDAIIIVLAIGALFYGLRDTDFSLNFRRQH